MTRNAERIFSLAISDAVASGNENEGWQEALMSFTATDTLCGAFAPFEFRCYARPGPKIAPAAAPEARLRLFARFLRPGRPVCERILRTQSVEAASTYYHVVTSKDPFHKIVLSLKERSDVFRSSETHLLLERKIVDEATAIAENLRRRSANSVEGSPRVFFVPLPDHSASTTSCAIVTHEGELESSNDYSRGHLNS